MHSSHKVMQLQASLPDEGTHKTSESHLQSQSPLSSSSSVVSVAFSSLSQEVVDEIIDHVRGDDSPWPLLACATVCRTFQDDDSTWNLLACATVCRSFQSRSQKYLFTDIRIFGLNDKEKLVKKVHSLHSALHENRLLASHVRNIEFYLKKTNIGIFHHPMLLSIMSLITQAISGREFRFAIEVRRDNNFSPEVLFDDNHAIETQLVQPFLAPYVTSMALCGLSDIPVSMVASCRRLEWLNLHRVTLEHRDGELPPTLRPRLDGFLFDDCSRSIRDLAKHYLDFSGLTMLECGGDVEEFNDMLYILGFCSSSLEILKLTCLDADYGQDYDLSLLPNLRELSVILTFAPQYDEPLTKFCYILRTIPTKNKIDLITITALESGTSYSVPGELSEEEDWSFLDKMLIRVSNGKRMAVTLLMEYAGKRIESDDDNLANWPDDLLPLTTQAPHIRKHYCLIL
ncbi:hypothetical protein BDZ97DRAFT_1840486 [Flammula alnicola]|nr:hypothetical protein BDZ97DRAFT_1840486 [Flammula alnicola]